MIARRASTLLRNVVTLSLPCEGLTSCSRLRGQAVERTAFSLAMAETDRGPHQPLGKPKKVLVCRSSNERKRLWQVFFADPSKWWDNRFDKKSARSPDFRHKDTNEVLWIENSTNPPWVKSELHAMTQGQAQSNDGSNVDVHHGAAGQEHNRMAGLHQAQVSESGIYSMTATFERGPVEGVNKNSSGTCGDVSTQCKAGQLKEALHILNQQGISADSNSYVRLLQECIRIKDLEMGKQVHAQVIHCQFKPNIFLLNTLVNMYAKSGSMVDAQQLFDKIPQRDVYTWTTMLAGYAKHGYGREAFEIYRQMMQEGVTPTGVTFTCILSVCASLQALEKGKEIHADIIKAGIGADIILETALVDMYAKCGSIEDARQVFENMAQRNVVSWSAMIAGYAQHGCGMEALEMYEQMIWEGVTPDKVTFLCVLNACASLQALKRGRDIHADISKARIGADIILETAVADMYAKCGSMKDARQVFDTMAKRDVVSWSALIAGYAQHGCWRDAFEIYERMIWEGMTPDRVTFICIVNACATIGDLGKGKEVHADIHKAGVAADIILETALADMYAKCGSIEDARRVFDNMAHRNVVSWSAMIAGYAQHGNGREALDIYELMIREGVTPDKITFVSVLNACASLASFGKGKEVHADICKAGIAPDLILETALVDMYAKCGSVKDARNVFNKMAERSVVSYNVMTAGYAQHGNCREAFQLFEQMQQEGLNPDCITFIFLLSACSHVGLLDEGRRYFESMSQDHGLTPMLGHFGCMVDLMGRAGLLDEAHAFIKEMPIQADSGVWGALLGACRIHGNVELAQHVANRLLQLDPQHTTT